MILQLGYNLTEGIYIKENNWKQTEKVSFTIPVVFECSSFFLNHKTYFSFKVKVQLAVFAHKVTLSKHSISNYLLHLQWKDVHELDQRLLRARNRDVEVLSKDAIHNLSCCFVGFKGRESDAVRTNR